MIIDQISVFLENKPGRLTEITALLAEAQISIQALSLADTSDFGILRLIVDDAKKASDILKENNVTVRLSKVMEVEVDNIPGGLHKAMKKLTDCGVNVEYMYVFIKPCTEKATLVLRPTDLDAAVKCLEA